MNRLPYEVPDYPGGFREYAYAWLAQEARYPQDQAYLEWMVREKGMPEDVARELERRDSDWIAYAGSVGGPIESGHVGPEYFHLQALPEVLGPIAALRVFGQARYMQKIRVELQRYVLGPRKDVRESQEVDELLKVWRANMEEFFEVWEIMEGSLQRAEERLEKYGLVFDHQDGKVKVKRAGRRGKPLRFLTCLAGAVWEVERPRFEQEEGDDAWNSSRLRERIAGVLRWYLPEEWLDTGHHGDLATAIGNYVDNPERYSMTQLLESLDEG